MGAGKREVWGTRGRGRGTAWGQPGRKAFSRMGQIPREVRAVPTSFMDKEVE